MSEFFNTESGGFLILMALISSGALVTLIKATTSMIKFFIDRRPFSNLKMLEFLQDSIDIQDYLFEIIKGGADHAIIFAAHNGGGIPQVGKSFYTSAIYKDWNRTNINVIPSYENISIDSEYIKNLLEVIRNGYCLNDIKDMNDSQLKHHFEHLGLSQNIMYNIGVVDKQYFYISIGTKSGKFNQTQLTSFELLVNNIKNTIVKH
jgi:hypothetical protein